MTTQSGNTAQQWLRGLPCRFRPAAGNHSYQPSKVWFWLIGVLGVLYIIVEFAFNAELVDLASSISAGREALEAMARKGEILSGLGMTLILIGFIDKKWGISRRYGLIASLASLLVVGYMSQKFMAWAQPAIVESIVSSSSAEDRAKALNMTLFKHGAAEGSIIFDGERIGAEPRDRVLLALLGPMAYANEQTQQKLLESQTEIIQNLVIASTQGDDVRGWQNYQNVRQSIRSRYDDYIKQAGRAHDAKDVSQDRIAQAIKQVRAEGAARYTAYQQASQDFYRRNPGGSTTDFHTSVGYPPRLGKNDFLRHPKVCSEAYSDMHKRGIKVPSGWCPFNEGAVGTALVEGASQQVDSSWTKRSRDMFGQVVPKDLTEQQFRSLPTVRQSIASSLSALPCTKGNAYLTAEQFRKQCVMPDVHKGLENLLNTYAVDVAQLADGGRHEERGKLAVRALVIPPVAIFFSLFFSLFALTKYMGRYRLAVVIGLVALPSLLPVPNGEIADFLLGSGQHSWSPSGLAIKWVMAVEPVVYATSHSLIYPVNGAINVLSELWSLVAAYGKYGFFRLMSVEFD